MKEFIEILIKILEDPNQSDEVKELARELIKKQLLLEDELLNKLRRLL